MNAHAKVAPQVQFIAFHAGVLHQHGHHIVTQACSADQEKASSCKDLAAVTKQMQTIERDIGAQVLKSIPYSDNI